MVNQERKKEIEERIKYQRAIYRYHDCDDPALKEHFAGIIKSYEESHGLRKKKEDPRQLKLALEYNGHGLA